MLELPPIERDQQARRILALLTLAAALCLAANALWIPIKAQVAQILLSHAWQRSENGETHAKPWPWADTWPVARLRVQEHDVDLIVLAGATGRTLAFGPGHIDGTAKPGTEGNCVFSGHRDTHFSFLRYVLPGEVMTLETPNGNSKSFRVTARHIVYNDEVQILDDTGDTTLTLLTCYPFDAIQPGGPLRYVVRAELLRT